MSSHYIVHCDGGARGNPGPAGIGVIIQRKTEDGRLKTVAELAEYIGETTNNQAEYRAVIRALEEVQRLGGQGSVIECVLDSELVAEQLSGNFRVKHKELQPLYARVRELVLALGGQVHFRSVPRGENKRADRLVNQAIDRSLATSN